MESGFVGLDVVAMGVVEVCCGCEGRIGIVCFGWERGASGVSWGR